MVKLFEEKNTTLAGRKTSSRDIGINCDDSRRLF